MKFDLPTKKMLVFTLVAITFISNSVYANVYKWRDSKGRTQYSDAPPTANYTLVTRGELVNALQSKDVCTLPSATPSVNIESNTTQFSQNFNFKVLGGASAGVRPSISTLNRNNLPNNTPNNIFGIRSKNRNVTPNIASNNAKLTALSPIKPQANTASSTSKIPTTIASITKFVASHAMPTVISQAVANPVVKLVTPTAASPTSIPARNPVALSNSIASGFTPTTVAINQPSTIVQAALMPAVDISKNMVPALGFSNLRLEPTAELPQAGSDGAFRIGCAPSHMSNDDPIIYPNQPGAAHHHTFFGNTATNAKSDVANLRSAGNSTCNGGIMNKSAYWIPSMIDTATNTPIKPEGMLVYYKSGDLGFVSNEPVTQPPKGLRMIAGNSKANPNDGTTVPGHFTCNTPTGQTHWSKTIPNCNVGDSLTMHIDFPQCWDGKNLDSPDHKSHMAAREFISHTSIEMRCPSSHPVRIPLITFNVNFSNTKANQMNNWRLASDNYSSTTAGGYSAHADWVNGWDEQLLSVIVKDCLQSRGDCHAHLAGGGKKMF